MKLLHPKYSCRMFIQYAWFLALFGSVTDGFAAEVIFALAFVLNGVWSSF